jgi:hypothetical protein
LVIEPVPRQILLVIGPNGGGRREKRPLTYHKYGRSCDPRRQ